MEPSTEFGRYLDSLACDDADSSEEEDQKSQPVETKISKAARKGSNRHEDPDWIASQCVAATTAKESNPSSKCEKTELNILRAWSITTDFETALQHIRDEKTKAACESSTVPNGGGAVNDLFCVSRIWGGGWGGQCTRPRLQGDTYCTMHRAELERQGYSTHGRIDGAIPPKKRKEFEKWQNLLRSREKTSAQSAGHKAHTTLTDSKEFSEDGWRSMGRGAGESGRAFEFRTGIREGTDRKALKRHKAKLPKDEASEEPTQKRRAPTKAEHQSIAQNSAQSSGKTPAAQRVLKRPSKKSAS